MRLLLRVKRKRHNRKNTACSLILCLSMIIFVLISPGCSSLQSDQEMKGEINVFNWGEYISNGEEGTLDVIAEFEKTHNINVNYTTFETNEQLYNILKKSNSSYDIIFPSDYMISKLIEENMLFEIDFSNIPNFSNIMEDYKNLSFDPSNKYSVPYAWGTTALVYNKTMVTGEIKGWDVLWDPAYEGKLLMFNNSRDSMAIAIQMCGLDVNNITKDVIDQAAEKLREQKPLVKKYVMDQVLTEMENNQSAVAPYYAGDILQMMENNKNLDYAMPEEGANWFVDSMCIPSSSKNKALAEEFINFMLEPEVAKENSLYIGYSTPNKAAYDLLDEELRNNPLVYPPRSYLDKCYSFSNLPGDIYNYMEEQFIKVSSR